ncbi:MAG TPA: hypothetical protein VF733_00270 [Candidatus Saccharimonadales bacterium]
MNSTYSTAQQIARLLRSELRPYRSMRYKNVHRDTSADILAEPPKSVQKALAKKELRQAIGGAHEVLMRATTVFPFVLFPDTITIDRTKLTITHRWFFRVAEVIPIRIEDVLNVTANVGPFFGCIKIVTRFFESTGKDNHYEIKYLTRADALRIKHIMQGYIIATQKQIDSSALSTKELATLLVKLGEGGPDEG